MSKGMNQKIEETYAMLDAIKAEKSPFLLEIPCDRCGGTGDCPADRMIFGWVTWCEKCKSKKYVLTPEGRQLAEFIIRHVDTSEGRLYIRP